MTQKKHTPTFSMSDEQRDIGVNWLERLKSEVVKHKQEARVERLKKHRLSDQWLRELSIKANQLPPREVIRQQDNESSLN